MALRYKHTKRCSTPRKWLRLEQIFPYRIPFLLIDFWCVKMVLIQRKPPRKTPLLLANRKIHSDTLHFSTLQVLWSYYVSFALFILPMSFHFQLKLLPHNSTLTKRNFFSFREIFSFSRSPRITFTAALIYPLLCGYIFFCNFLLSEMNLAKQIILPLVLNG